uniref:Rho guanine nucleotide exchange factor 16 n=1 Tax=Junco hyemalis TaxID=40217 RepID=A0A8C5JDP3_JUNHY
MSRGSSATSVDDKTLLLEYRCHPVRPEPPSPTCSSGKLSPTTAPSATPVSPLGSPTSAEPRRIVLSTHSPAALKVGTQQLIPKSLAVSSKPKNSPSRPQSFAGSREPLSPDPKRAAVPVLALQAEDEDDGGGALKRNLRNMSYRAAMKGLGADMEPAKAPPSLKPVSEDGSALPDRSPGRSKKTLGRKRVQKRGGSFKDQPQLYQEIRERGLNSVSHESDEDLLEEALPEEPSPLGAAIVVQSYRPAQVTWSQLPEVLESGILQRISPEERKRQEAMFEIITSEYSYMHSLNILVSHFMRSEELKETMTQTEHHHLFSNIGDILTVSKSFFEDLEKRHQEHLLIPDISDIVEEHASKHFNPYISYCSNEVYQQRTLDKLLTTNPLFKETLKQIERKPECGGLPMISFLILPMQRVTRLPLLLDTVQQKTNARTAAYGAATRAVKAISKLVKSCNDGARAMERTEQMYTLQKQLEFGKKKVRPCGSEAASLVCWNGVHSPWKILFKRPLNVVTVFDQLGGIRGRDWRKWSMLCCGALGGGSWPLLTVPAAPCPADLSQVEITRAYLAKEADELSLQQADVVLVLGEEDGWCWGERLRDGERGWFPQACARPITSRVAAEGNVRRMERLRIETNV